MTADVLAAVRRSGVVGPADRVLALVSGGRDSVCLLDVLVRICGAAQVAALHVDYGLRGAESDGDARAVRELCAALGVPLPGRCGPPAAPSAGNLQAWARDLRYARALELAGDGALIATGHTASDQAETVLYRLAASPGRRALLGMTAREGRLIRPLLTLTRERDRGLLRGARPGVARGRLERGRALRARAASATACCGELRRVHPAAEANVVRSAELLRAEAEVLDEVVGVALAGRARIALEHLAGLPPALARLIVIRLAEDAGGRPVPGVGARVAELLALARAGGSATLDVGGGVRAVVEYGVLRFERCGRGRAGRALAAACRARSRSARGGCGPRSRPAAARRSREPRATAASRVLDAGTAAARRR